MPKAKANVLCSATLSILAVYATLAVARVSAALEPALGEDIVFTKVMEKPRNP